MSFEGVAHTGGRYGYVIILHFFAMRRFNERQSDLLIW